jgi:GAF domain
MSASAKLKLVLDEDFFQKLLAAAYVVQENRNCRTAEEPVADVAEISAEIAATRSRIVSENRDVPYTLELISERLRVLTRADGASICLLRDGYLNSAACSGTAAKVPGGSLAAHSLVATERLRNGHPFQSSNAHADMRLDLSLCAELQIGSLLTIPIERQNEVLGLVELRWKGANAIQDSDLHVCQLMAGLVVETIGQQWGGANVQLAREHSAPAVAASKNPGGGTSNWEHKSGVALPVVGDELQSKWAAMWFMQQAQGGPTASKEPGFPLSSEAELPIDPAMGKRQLPNANDVEPKNDAECGAGNEAGSAGLKRKPGSVLSVLKAHFKAPAAARMLAAFVLLTGLRYR